MWYAVGKGSIVEVQDIRRNTLWADQNCNLRLKPILLNSIWFVNVVLSKKLLSNYISAKVDAQILSKKSSLFLVTVLMKIQSK